MYTVDCKGSLARYRNSDNKFGFWFSCEDTIANFECLNDLIFKINDCELGLCNNCRIMKDDNPILKVSVPHSPPYNFVKVD